MERNIKVWKKNHVSNTAKVSVFDFLFFKNFCFITQNHFERYKYRLCVLILCAVIALA